MKPERERALRSLPWRGPGAGRPDELPLPPGRMPLRFAGNNRKRWRYVAAFSDELMICAARVQVGPAAQTFWAIWDRQESRLYERTRMRLPGARGEVWHESPTGEPIENAPEDGAILRLEARHPEAGEVRATVRVGPGLWAESVCPNGEGGFVWTRKRVGAEAGCDVRIGGRRIRAAARSAEDESAGYHARHTLWSWSAGVGVTTDGTAVGWNLVQGVNDPPARSERAIWVGEETIEPGPVRFEELNGIAFEDGAHLAFEAECERARTESKLIVRSSYRQPFGTFTGTLPGGLELASGMGVMEHHDAVW